MSFPQGLFWATAEKLIFKYMKYAMQHEKKKQISWKQVSFPPPYSHSQSLLYQNSRQKRETHPYWNPLMWVRTKKKKRVLFSVFSKSAYMLYISKCVLSDRKVRFSWLQFSPHSDLCSSVTLSLRPSWIPLVVTTIPTEPVITLYPCFFLLPFGIIFLHCICYLSY